MTAEAVGIRLHPDVFVSCRRTDREFVERFVLKKIVIPVRIDDSEPRGSLLYELACRNWIDVHPDPTSKLDVVEARTVESLKQAGWTPPPQRSPTPGSLLQAPTIVAPSESAALENPFARPPQPSTAEPTVDSPTADSPRQPAAGPVSLIIGLLDDVVSIVIFFALSKSQARRELRAHMQIF